MVCTPFLYMAHTIKATVCVIYCRLPFLSCGGGVREEQTTTTTLSKDSSVNNSGQMGWMSWETKIPGNKQRTTAGYEFWRRGNIIVPPALYSSWTIFNIRLRSISVDNFCMVSSSCFVPLSHCRPFT